MVFLPFAATAFAKQSRMTTPFRLSLKLGGTAPRTAVSARAGARTAALVTTAVIAGTVRAISSMGKPGTSALRTAFYSIAAIRFARLSRGKITQPARLTALRQFAATGNARQVLRPGRCRQASWGKAVLPVPRTAGFALA